MALSGITVAGVSAELLLANEGFIKNLDKSAKAAQNFEKAVQREFDRINGTQATKQVEIIGKAIEKMGGLSKLSAQQVDNLRARVEALAKAGARLPSALSGLGKGPAAGGLLAGNIQTQALGSLQGQLGPLGGLLSGLSGGALAATAGVAGLAVALGSAASAAASAVSEFAEFSGHLTDLSAKTGIGTTALQELEFAGSFVGISLEEMTTAITKMQIKLAEGDTVFERLGLSLKELQSLKPEEAFFRVAEAIDSIPDPNLKLAAAREAFDKLGPAIIPALSQIEGLREEFKRLGIGIDADVIKKGDQLDDAMNKAARAAESLGRSLASIAVDAGLVQFFEDIASAVAQMSANLEGNIEILKILFGGGPTAPKPADLGAASAAARAAVAEAKAMAAGTFVGPAVPAAGFVTTPEEKARQAAAKQAAAEAKAAAKKAASEAEQNAKAVFEANERAAEMATKSWQEFEKFTAQLGKQMREEFEQATEALAAKVSGDFAEKLRAALDLGETFGQAQGQAESLAATFDFLALSFGGVANQTDAGLQKMGEQFAALDQSLPGVAERLAEINAEIQRRGGNPIISEEELRRIEEARARLQDLANELAGIAGIIGSVGGLFEALGVSAESGLGRAIGALEGVAGSAANVFASLAAGDIKGAIAAGISGITSLVKGIGGLFGKSDAEKAGEIAGRVLGTAISEEMAKAISETSKALGIAKEMASLLHLGDVMEESGQNAVAFGDQMTSLLQAIEGGAVPAAEGIAALGDAFSRLAEEAEAGSVGAMVQMGKLANEARAFGQSIPEIDEAVRAAVSDSTGALGALGGLKLVDADDARAQAQIFLNVFNGVLATEGIVAAAQAIQPALKTFQEQLSAAGIGKGVADSILGPIKGAMSLLKNDMTKGGAEGAQALKTILESQLKAGFLDTNTFEAIQQQAGTAFDQMIEGGASTKAALQAVAPLLAQIQATASATGAAIDPVSQKLIDQAKAAGIAFPVDTGAQMVTLLGQVVELLGGIPATFSDIGSATTTTFDTMSAEATETSSTMSDAFTGVGQEISASLAPVGEALQSEMAGIFTTATSDAMQFVSVLNRIDGTTVTIPFKFTGEELPFSDGTQIPQFASGSGGVRDFGRESLALLHGREAVIPEGDLHKLLGSAVALGRSGGGGAGGGPPIVVRLELDGRVLAQAQVSNERRNVGGVVTQGRRPYR